MNWQFLYPQSGWRCVVCGNSSRRLTAGVWVGECDLQRVLPGCKAVPVLPCLLSAVPPLSIILRAWLEFVVARVFFGKASLNLLLEELLCFSTHTNPVFNVPYTLTHVIMLVSSLLRGRFFHLW